MSILISVQTITTTGKITIVAPLWQVVTATNDDLSFRISPSNRTALTNLFDKVAAACGGTRQAAKGAADLIKRVGQCEFDHISRPGVGGGAVEFDIPGLFGITTAGEISVAL